MIFLSTLLFRRPLLLHKTAAAAATKDIRPTEAYEREILMTITMIVDDTDDDESD